MTAPPADPDLLARFLADRDEAAFAELVRRHAPGVWGACRRRLDHLHDAEDAFQAAFLVLVRRAGRLRPGTPLGPWLGKVAALTARNVARGNRRRAAVAGPMDHDIAAATPTEPAVDLDAALRDLPDADRTAVVLCHLDGLSRKEAAERLGCPEGTLSARLSRAMGKLRLRLADEVPPGLVRSTVRVAVVVGVSSGSAGVSPAVAQLAEEAIRMLWVKKLTAAGLVLAAAGMVGLGVAGTADAGGQDKGVQPAPAAKAEKPPAAKPRPLTADEVSEGLTTLDGARKLITERRAELDRMAADVNKREADLLRYVQERGLNPGRDKPAANAEKTAAVDRVAELEKAVRELREENQRLKDQAAEVTKFLGDQLGPRGAAPPPAAKLDPPPAADEVAELQKRIDAEDARLKAEAERLADGRVRLDALRRDLHAAKVGRATPKDDLVQVAKPDPPAAADKVPELVRQLDDADRAVVGAQMRYALVQERLRLAREVAKEARKDGGADLTLVILGDVSAGWVARYQLTEKTAGGSVFYLTPSAEGLAKLLARAKADPNGPKTVAVQAEEACKAADIQAALVALKAAGFKTVAYKGPLEGDLHGAARGPGAWKYDRAKEYTGPIDLADLPKAIPGKKE